VDFLSILEQVLGKEVLSYLMTARSCFITKELGDGAAFWEVK
jgi:hypothetical protein